MTDWQKLEEKYYMHTFNVRLPVTLVRERARGLGR